MAKWPAIFLQTDGLQSRLARFGHSSGGEHRLRHDRCFFHGRSPPHATVPVHLLEWFQADAPETAIHPILLLRCAPVQSREPKSAASRVYSLHLWRQLADQVLDLFGFMPVTYQKRVFCPHHNKIMDSKQCDGCPSLLENDVVAGIERGDSAVRGVSLIVFLKIVRHRSPASDVVPVETGFHHKDAVCLFHDRVIKGDPWQFAEALTQRFLKIFRSS